MKDQLRSTIQLTMLLSREYEGGKGRRRKKTERRRRELHPCCSYFQNQDFFGVLSTSVSLHFIFSLSLYFPSHSSSLSLFISPLTHPLSLSFLTLSTFLPTERGSLSSSVYSHSPFYGKLDSYHHLDPLEFLEVIIITVVVDLSSLLIHILCSSPSPLSHHFPFFLFLSFFYSSSLPFLFLSIHYYLSSQFIHP